MGALRTLILVTFSTLAASASAQVTEIYKCVDSKGNRLYTSDKRETSGRKCELVSREVNVVPAQKQPPSAAPSSFPRETPQARASAKERQRDILEKELASEQQLLAQARKELSDQESTRGGDERNYARVLERLQPFKDSVDLHQKNIDALKRELSNIR
jgi:septal ring factor EnvC (AmiA/AmiB activator)